MSGTVRSNILFLLLIQGGNYIFPLFLFPYLARTLGVKNFGALAYSQAIIQYVVIVTDYGFNLTATRRVSIARDDPEQLSRIFWSTFNLRLLFALIGALVLIVTAACSSRLAVYAPIIAAGYGAAIGNAILPIWLFQGMEQVRPLLFASFAAKLISVIATVALVRSAADTAVAAATIGSNQLIMGFLAIFAIYKRRWILWALPSISDYWGALKDGFPLFISSLAGSVYINLNTLILGNLYGDIEVGRFAAAEKIRGVAQSFVAVLAQAYYPRLSLYYERSTAEATHTLKTATIAIVGLAAVISLGMYFVAPSLIPPLLGQQFESAIALVKLESVLPLIISVAYVCGHLGLLALGETALVTKLYVATALIHVSYAFILTSTYSSSGTVVSIVITESVASMALAFFFMRRLRQLRASGHLNKSRKSL